MAILLNVINGLERVRRKRLKTFCLDVLFCILSAAITFFAALIITDGQLHPALFFGMSIGFSFTHILCGRYIAKFVCIVTNLCRVATAYMHSLCVRSVKWVKNKKIEHKKDEFFSKNS